jgi:hypothetical protein
MAFRTLIPAASSSLASLAMVKKRLSLQGTDQDEILSGIILGVSSALQERLGFSLGRARLQETFFISRGARIWLSMFPVAPESVTVLVDGSALDADRFTVEPESGELRRRRGCVWPQVRSEMEVAVQYHGLYLLPEQVADWSGSAPAVRGKFARPSSPSILRFECTAAGTTGDAEPAWPEIAGNTVLDGEVTWTARTAWELPLAWQEHAYVAAMSRFQMVDVAAGVQSVNVDDVGVQFFASQSGQILSQAALDFVEHWRLARGVRF